MFMHICALLSSLTFDNVRNSVNRAIVLQGQIEGSGTTRKRALSTEARFSCIGEHHLVMVSTTVVIISIIAGIDPDNLLCFESCGK